MADIAQKTNLSVCVTVSNKLQDLEITNGQLIFIRDKHRIAFDFGGERKFYNQIIELETEADRLDLSAPVNGVYYFVIGNLVLWTYQNGWVQLTTPPEDIVYIGTEMPETGNEKTLYVNKQNKEISIFDSNINDYVVVADKKETISESDIDLLFV